MKRTEKAVLVPYEKYIRLCDSSSKIPNSNENYVSDKNQIPDASNTYISKPKSLSITREIILGNIPNNSKAQAELVLNHIENNENIGWNESGEFTINNTPVKNSHIIDLVKDIVVLQKFDPIGTKEFYTHLKGIPLSIIKNPKRRALLLQGDGESDLEIPRLTPPGIPNKQPKSLEELGYKVNEEFRQIKGKKLQPFPPNEILKGDKKKNKRWIHQWKEIY